MSALSGKPLQLESQPAEAVQAAPPPIATSVCLSAPKPIATPEPTPEPTPEATPEATPEPTYTEDDLFCMAAVIYQEAGGDAATDEARVYVGSVVLNRLANGYWGDTLREVLEAPGQYGLFCKTGVCFPERAYTDVEKHAVDRAYEIAEQVLTDGSVLPENVIWQAEFKQGDGVYAQIGNTYFCYSK